MGQVSCMALSIILNTFANIFLSVARFVKLSPLAGKPHPSTLMDSCIEKKVSEILNNLRWALDSDFVL